MLTDRDKSIIVAFSEIIVSFSAGKDSLSCLRWALETDLPVRVILADTGNEPDETPDYIHYVETRLGVPIEVYKRPRNDFFSIVGRRGMWPIPGRCLVSSTVKRDDFKWYLDKTHTSEDALVILGHRRSESQKRARLVDFAPTSRSGRPVYRPILDWSVDDVFSFLSKHKLIAHPAYGKGRKRVGCIWCVNSQFDDIVRDEQLYPERCAMLRELRRQIGLPSCPAGVSQLQLFDSWPACKYEAVHCE